MKKIVLIIGILSFIVHFSLLTNPCSAQWIPQNSGTTNDLMSVFFLNVDTGFAVGYNCTMLKTTDGGNHWVNYGNFCNPVFETFNSIYFTNADTGYIAGTFGKIYKTVNGGNDWVIIYSDSNSPTINSVYFTDKNTGYASASQPVSILKTTNGGKSWQNRDTLNSAYTGNFSFPDSKIGYTAGGNLGGSIYKTTDEGNTWNTVYFDSLSSELFGVNFINVDTGYVVGGWTNPGIILNTTNGGNSWITQYSDSNLTLNAIYFTNKNKGYVVGEYGDSLAGIIFKTFNGGKNWVIQVNERISELESIYFVNENVGYAIGHNGTILKTINGGDGINQLNPNNSQGGWNIYPNPTTEILNIKFNITLNKQFKQSSILQIINLQGQKVLEKLIINISEKVDVNNLPVGLYIIKIYNAQSIFYYKFIKE